MRAHARSLAAAVAIVTAPAVVRAEPKPKPVETKDYKDKLIVLRDDAGGTYVVAGDHSVADAHLFYGTGKTLYEQIVIARSTNGDAWDVHVLSPRVSSARNGSVLRKQDGSYARFCGAKDEVPLAELTGDKAKAVLDKYQFMSTAMVRRAHLLARDDHGVYYYVDEIRETGKGYRVFVGRKGAMKELPLVDIASDSDGQVFSTKNGELRLVTSHSDDANGKETANWARGESNTPLRVLDVVTNSPLIYAELGIYSFIGTICDGP